LSTFNPCKGKTACRDDGKQCLSCGRSFAEIEQTRNLIDALAEFVCVQGYDNVNEFAAYVADKVKKKIKHRRETRILLDG
jgi:protoheme ferro-lyase